jgi:hypothetical protein
MLVFACARAASAPTAMAERILRGISGTVCEADGENLMEVCLLVDSSVGLPESVNERYGRSADVAWNVFLKRIEFNCEGCWTYISWRDGRLGGGAGMAGGSVRGVGGVQRIAPCQKSHPGLYIHFEHGNT